MTAVSDFIYIARPHTFLNVRKPFPSGMLLPHKIRRKGMHARRSEKYGRIVLGYKTRRLYDLMSPLFEKRQKLFA